jgi:hypothetical protein
MTMTQFVVILRDAAKEHPRPVFAVDFEPRRDGGIQVTFRYKAEQRFL